MNIRINNIGALKTTKLVEKPEDVLFDVSIVKYHPNRYYGALNTYLKNGWEDMGDYIEHNKSTIDKKCFEGKEENYVIAFLRYNIKESTTELESVADRLLYIEKEDKEDFFEVYRIADGKLNELANKILD